MNEVLNKTTQDAVRISTFKVSYNDTIYHYKEINDRDGNLIDSYIYDEHGSVIDEPDLFESIIDVINEFERGMP